MQHYNTSKRGLATIFSSDLTNYILTFCEDPIIKWTKHWHEEVLFELDNGDLDIITFKMDHDKVMKELVQTSRNVNKCSNCRKNKPIRDFCETTVKNKKIYTTCVDCRVRQRGNRLNDKLREQLIVFRDSKKKVTQFTIARDQSDLAKIFLDTAKDITYDIQYEGVKYNRARIYYIKK